MSSVEILTEVGGLASHEYPVPDQMKYADMWQEKKLQRYQLFIKYFKKKYCKSKTLMLVALTSGFFVGLSRVVCPFSDYVRMNTIVIRRTKDIIFCFVDKCSLFSIFLVCMKSKLYSVVKIYE
jgi:hypothetical protein